MLDNKLLEDLNLINSKLNILNVDSNKIKKEENLDKDDIFLLDKFEKMNNEINNITSNIKEKDFRSKSNINPYIIIFTLYVIFILFYTLIE
jgi:hypothetical protein